MSADNRHPMLAGGFVAVGLISILGFVTWALVFRALPEANQNALTLLIGVLSANVGMVVGFFFGSSADTRKLVETSNVQAKTAATAGAALGTPDSAMLIPAGTTATATATPDGTIIEKEAPK